MEGQVRAKFSVWSVEEVPVFVWKGPELGNVEEKGARVVLGPVYGGSPENDAFFKATPNGQIQLAILNESAAAAFKPGDEFYVDFTLASRRETSG